MESHVDEDTAWLRRIVHWVVNVVIVLTPAWFLVYGFYTQALVSGNSIQPVLAADGVVLISHLAYDMGKLERFNIVIFEREGQKKSVKQVVGLPGGTVQMRGGYVFINSELLEAPDGLEQVSLVGRADTPIQLEEDEYFLLGSDRDSSEDSRSSNTGNVKREQTQGKVWFRTYSLPKLGLIRSRQKP